MAPRHTDTWKKAEAAIARFIPGAVRRGADYGGKNGGKNDLIVMGPLSFLSVQAKHSKAPNWSLIIKALQQAREQKERVDDIPVGVIHQEYTRYAQCLVVMTLEEFEQLLKRKLEEDHD